MLPLLVLLTFGSLAYAKEQLPASCDRPIYCGSDLLHHVQLSGIFGDSKDFVDMRLLQDSQVILDAFQDLLNKTDSEPTKDQIKSFVNEYFAEGDELEDWTPPDHSDSPKFLNRIRDPVLRKFGSDVNSIWPSLGRKVKSEVINNPDRFSLIPVTHGFVIPGGRFKELYYWDTYWIVEGLLICGMKDTAKGVIENLIELLKTLGHVPNGSRWYYQQRSQAPLLTAMVSLYVRNTRDIKFLKENIGYLEDELNYWLETQVTLVEKNNKYYNMMRYYAPSSGPRPESYKEDYNSAQVFKNDEQKEEFYVEIKSAAESGWDFSSRWIINATTGDNNANLSSTSAKYIIPVDLNAMFANALQEVARFTTLLGNPRKGAHWGYIAKQWRNAIQEVLWNDEVGCWLDYDNENNKHRNYFYPSNVAPLWMRVVDDRFVKKVSSRVVKYLVNTTALSYPGGVPVSLIHSGEQWDFPNAWPPEVSIVVNALDALGTRDGKDLAFDVAQKWVRVNLKGYNNTAMMFEKYDAMVPGQYGGGGEYTVQSGFGWTNGVVLEFLNKYGNRLTANDSAVLGL